MADAAVIPEMGFAGGVLVPEVAVVTQPRPRGADKPGGGLWLSPLRRDAAGNPAGTDWTDWCAREGLDTGEDARLLRFG